MQRKKRVFRLYRGHCKGVARGGEGRYQELECHVVCGRKEVVGHQGHVLLGSQHGLGASGVGFSKKEVLTNFSETLRSVVETVGLKVNGKRM